MATARRPISSSSPPYRALHAHRHGESANAYPPRPLRRRPGRGTRLTAEAAGIYLDSKRGEVQRRDAPPVRPSWLRSRTAQRDARRRANQRHREPLGAARRAARSTGAITDRGRGRRRRRRRPRGYSTAWLRWPHFGPVMAYKALRHYSRRDSCDESASSRNSRTGTFAEATRNLEPERTLFIVCSKTLATLESATRLAPGCWTRSRAWPGFSSPSRRIWTEWRSCGIDTDNAVWDWVGGRSSNRLCDRPLHDDRGAARSASAVSRVPHCAGRGEPARPDGPARRLVTTSSAPRPRRCCRTTSTSSAPRLAPAARAGRTATRAPQLDPGRADTGAVYWGEPGTNGQHSFYQPITRAPG